MTDLSLDEKLNYAAYSGKKKEAEKHFFDAAQPFYPLGFSIHQRNPGHWDIIAPQPDIEALAHNATQPAAYHMLVSADGTTRARVFRIRGEAGDVVVMDERRDPYRPHPRESLRFRSVMAAMVWICEELMQEPTP